MCVPDRSDRRLDTVGIRGPERARMPTFSLDVVLTVGNNRGPERALTPTFGSVRLNSKKHLRTQDVPLVRPSLSSHSVHATVSPVL